MKKNYIFLIYATIVVLQFQGCQRQLKNSSISSDERNTALYGKENSNSGDTDHSLDDRGTTDRGTPKEEDGSTTTNGSTSGGTTDSGSSNGGSQCNQFNHTISFFEGSFGDVDHYYQVGSLSCNENQICGKQDFDPNKGKNGRRCFSDYCLYSDLNGRCIKFNADQNKYEYSSCMGGTNKQCYITESCAKDALCNKTSCISLKDSNYTNLGVQIIRGVPVTVLKDNRCTCDPGSGDPDPVPEPDPTPDPDPVPTDSDSTPQ